MKPTPQTPRNFPLTDYSFQSTAEAPTRAVAHPATKAPAFHKLSSDFNAETRRDYIAEFFFFILISGIAAWAIMSMLACLAWIKIVI